MASSSAAQHSAAAGGGTGQQGTTSPRTGSWQGQTTCVHRNLARPADSITAARCRAARQAAGCGGPPGRQLRRLALQLQQLLGSHQRPAVGWGQVWAGSECRSAASKVLCLSMGRRPLSRWCGRMPLRGGGGPQGIIACSAAAAGRGAPEGDRCCAGSVNELQHAGGEARSERMHLATAAEGDLIRAATGSAAAAGWQHRPDARVPGESGAAPPSGA